MPPGREKLNVDTWIRFGINHSMISFMKWYDKGSNIFYREMRVHYVIYILCMCEVIWFDGKFRKLLVCKMVK